MSDNEKQPDPELEKEQREIRQRLVRRVAFAIGLIGVAAISLPLLDKIKSTPDNKPAPPPASDAHTTRIIPAPDRAAKQENVPAPQPTGTAEPSPAADKEPAQPTHPTAANPTQADTGNTTPETPSQPIAAARPQPITTLPASPKQAEFVRPTQPQTSDIRTPSRPQPTTPQSPTEPSPPAKPDETEIPVVPRSKMQTGQGYTVQLGVFANYANAKALQQRLANNGIKAQLETRVQLGPFHDKQEAEEAYRKIRQLGLPAVLVGQ